MWRGRDDIARWVEAAGIALPVAFDGGAIDPEALAVLDADITGADLVFLGETDHFREDCMKRRLADLRRLAGDSPTVPMGHAFHLAKDDRLLGKVAGVGPGGGLTPSLGHHVVQEFGLKAVSVWLIHGTGEDSQPFADLPRRFHYPRTTLNARLSGLRTPTLFRLADAPPGLFDQPIGIGHMYNAVQPVTLAGQVDAVLYLPTVTRMRSGRAAAP